MAGWKEFELEVMRDGATTPSWSARSRTSIRWASTPATRSPSRRRRRSPTVIPGDARRGAGCIRAIGVETGGSNVQFAVDPSTGGMVLIEMNPRVSRSSALASKATGFPIAKIAALLAVGYRLDEIRNDITRETLAAFEPTLDYVAVKIPRWAFEKFPAADPVLSTTMKSVGEVMAIGRTFKEALGKAWRGIEKTGFDLGPDAPVDDGGDLLAALGLAGRGAAPPGRAGAALAATPWTRSPRPRPSTPGSWTRSPRSWRSPRRSRGRRLATLEAAGAPARPKRAGLSDGRIALLTGADDGGVRAPPRGARRDAGVQVGRHLRRRVPGPDALPLLDLRGGGRGPAGDAAARRDPRRGAEPDRAGDRVRLHVRARGVRPGGGRLRVGDGQLQPRDGLHRLRHSRAASIFEPLSAEDVLAVCRKERPARGHRAVRRSDAARAWPRVLEQEGFAILGTSPAAIDLAEDRGKFAALLGRAGDPGAAARRGVHARGGPRGRPSDRIPGRRPALLRAGRPGDGDRLRRRRAGAVRRDGRAGAAGAPGPHRPVPGGRDRGRRRRRVRRRRRGVRRRGHGAHRRGRGALRRLLVSDPAGDPCRRRAGRDRGDHRPPSPGVSAWSGCSICSSPSKTSESGSSRRTHARRGRCLSSRR